MEWLIRKEREEEFMKMLGQLAEPQRAVLLLHFVGGFFGRRNRADHGSAARDREVANALREEGAAETFGTGE